jgi:hypothetical protein
LKPAQVNSSQDPILKNLSQKRAGGVAQGVGSPSSIPSTVKQTKTKQAKVYVK